MSKKAAPPAEGWASVADAARFIGTTPQNLRQHYLDRLADGDVSRNRPMRVRMPALIELIVETRVSERARPVSADPLLADGGDSPGLERYRLAKAMHAELDLEHRRGELIEKEKCREVLARWGITIRKMGERLTRRFGSEAHSMVSDAVEECRSIIQESLDAGD